ncbi:unnamed protein product, partial [Ixodes persulcatus]
LTLNDDEAFDPTPAILTWLKCRLSGSSPGVEHLLWTCVASAEKEVSSPSDPLPTTSLRQWTDPAGSTKVRRRTLATLLAFVSVAWLESRFLWPSHLLYDTDSSGRKK